MHKITIEGGGYVYDIKLFCVYLLLRVVMALFLIKYKKGIYISLVKEF
ncbi:hypothetical protein VSVS05_03018 [Vibrio scophthalmi]|uniref:Uncharacterized protein n=1 Tax=Vibrio scophthalmi TaxID=45658 RepID=A0A1C7FFD9_9VIBR|nr:hypothetical protein VSVS05_03018 [Vibrio scophthalmi]